MAWPGVLAEVKPGNSSLRLYGGAAFERVLDEFRAAACSLDCPPVSREKVSPAHIQVQSAVLNNFEGSACLLD